MSAYAARHRALPAPGRGGRVAMTITRGVLFTWIAAIPTYIGVLVVTG